MNLSTDKVTETFYLADGFCIQFDASINRFTELMQSAILPMTAYLKTCCLGDCTGISFIDSTPIRVCKNKRIKRNRVFKNERFIAPVKGKLYGGKGYLSKE